MNRSLILSFLVATLAGAAIWALSPSMTGHAEPWDADGVYYIVALIVSGFFSGLVAAKFLGALYVGSIVGQLSYPLLYSAPGPLIIVGFVFLLLWSLLFLGGAYVGTRVRVRSRFRSDAP